MYLSIIIVTHNSSGVIGKCLSSLKEYPPSRSHEIIVIDNASSDRTVEIIENEYPGVKLIANSVNGGYSRGINQGISSSEGRMILILNPDIIVRKSSVDTLIEFMEEHPEAGISGSKLLNTDGSLQYSCRSFYTVGALLLRRTFLGKLFPRAKALRDHLLTDYDHQSVREVDWLIGACMMVRRSAIENTGMMDERFFLYFEDVDWCYRMKQHGWKVYYVPDSVMTHFYERASAGSLISRSLLFHLVSLLRYYEKWNRFAYFFRRRRSLFKSLVFIFSDLAAVNLSFLAAYYIRLAADPFFVNSLYPLSSYRYFILFYNMIFLLSFLFGGMYRISRETPGAEELGRIIKVVVAGLAVLMASTYLSRIRMYSRAVIIGQAAFSVAAVFVFRRLIRAVHRIFVRAGFDHKRVLLAGSATEVEKFRRNIAAYPELGIDIAGYLNDEESSLGSADDISGILDRFKIQEIFIFPSVQSGNRAGDLIEEAYSGGVQVSLVSSIGRFLGTDVRVTRMGNDYLLSVRQGAFMRLRRLIVRLLDIIFSVAVIPLSCMLYLVLRVTGAVTGRVDFSVEKRYSSGGKVLRWPRVRFASHREGSDLFKPYLFSQILLGRLSFIGPPPLTYATGLSEAGVRCGLSGRWRIRPAVFDSASPEDEAAEMRNLTISGYLIMVLRSVRAVLRGNYPEWFYKEGL